jgi:prepilin-type N-terminal cleavage/methylation domain-containing protein
MKRWHEGFSLIEVLVAMVIFSIASLAVSKLMVGSSSAVSENAESTHAIALAQQKLENLRNLRYLDLASGSETRLGSEWKGMPFTVAWVVSNDTPITGTRTVVATVSWTSKGQTRSYATRSVYSQITAE